MKVQTIQKIQIKFKIQSEFTWKQLLRTEFAANVGVYMLDISGMLWVESGLKILIYYYFIIFKLLDVDFLTQRYALLNEGLYSPFKELCVNADQESIPRKKIICETYGNGILKTQHFFKNFIIKSQQQIQLSQNRKLIKGWQIIIFIFGRQDLGLWLFFSNLRLVRLNQKAQQQSERESKSVRQGQKDKEFAHFSRVWALFDTFIQCLLQKLSCLQYSNRREIIFKRK
ncbi:unnamed protein product [Paramecium primaurelia]|uniref:Uncharacterized protein n=1 Tax=Paramecium primaurelia TaxID=5886 RepID=A0A8S1LQ94_PARPR|nr:unnamed protein product [Paramecium primaurelia]